MPTSDLPTVGNSEVGISEVTDLGLSKKKPIFYAFQEQHDACFFFLYSP